MTSDAILVLRSIFQTIWSLFTSWLIPGTRTTPAEWLAFLLSVGITLRILAFFIGNASFGDDGSGKKK